MNKQFSDLYESQIANQCKMLNLGMYDRFTKFIGRKPPYDDVSLSSYHIQQLISEIGEVLDADKRWKNFRNEKYDKAAKVEELADCFIVLMNVCMYSGVTGEELERAISNKIEEVSIRIDDIAE